MIVQIGPPGTAADLEALAAGAFVRALGRRHHAVGPEGLFQLLCRFEILDSGIGPMAHAVIPGFFALAAPLGLDLADRLIEQLQRDAVFAAGITGDFDDLHRSEPSRFIEQIEDAPIEVAVGLIGCIQQRADDATAYGRRRLQRCQRDLCEHGYLAGQQIGGTKRVA